MVRPRLNTGKCIATVYIPEDEDFGMSPVKSMAAGKPVIGVAEGGLLETVKDGETGILINAFPSSEEVIQAVRQMTPEYAAKMRMGCEKRALKFRTEVFVEKMNKILRALRVFNTGAKMPLPIGSCEKRQVAKIVGHKIPENSRKIQKIELKSGTKLIGNFGRFRQKICPEKPKLGHYI